MKARQIPNQEARKKIYGEMQVIQHDNQPMLTIAHSIVYEPLAANVVGYKMSPLSRHEFQKVDLK